jgi:hypothetical protein
MGTLAPSAHNAQPWLFDFRDGVLTGRHDPRHDLPTLDFEHGATWVAFGAFLENLTIAAASLGLQADVAVFPDPAAPDLVFRAPLTEGPVRKDALLTWIARRVTNRRRGPRSPLPEGAAAALAAATEPFGVRLQLAASDEPLAAMAELIARCDRLTAFHPEIHRETMHGMRWTRREVEETRDGLDLHTMDLTPSERAGMELLSHWPTMNALRELGGGRALEDLPAKLVASASAIGLLTVQGYGREAYLQAGRALQRLWLTASSRGVSVQPMTSLPYLFARLERGRAEGLSEEDRATLRELRARYRQVFVVAEGHGEPLLLRLSVAEAPEVRSLRRRIEDVLTVG